MVPMRSQSTCRLLCKNRSSAGGVTFTSSIGSVIVRGVDNGVDFPQAIAGASVHLEGV